MTKLKELAQWASSRSQITYYWIGILMLILPNLFLSYSMDVSLVGRILNISLPLGVWMLILALGRKPGKTLLFPFGIMLLIGVVQLVLLTIFEGAVISVDLLLSLFSASGDEAGELLGGLILPIALVLVMLIVAVYSAICSWRSRLLLSSSFRRYAGGVGLGIILLSLPLAAWANRIQAQHTLRGDVYPLNVFYNIYITGSKLSQLAHLDETSAEHSYHASSAHSADEPEIYVFVLGETSRAYSYQLYGYPRPTNPLLSARDSSSIYLFRDVLTESNTTSKSVPIILSPADAEHTDRLPHVRGILTAFKEAGFHTAFISNQPENRSFLDHFAYEADEHYRIRDIIRSKRSLMDTRPIYDGDMLPFLDEVLKKGYRKLFVIMHGYGEHWSYPDRYPSEFSFFKDDAPRGARPKEKEKLVNAYDNAIRYNDYFLDAVIKRLESYTEASTAMYYTSDHGEDIYDDARERILHSSPTLSYYQLHVPAILWLSPAYRERYQTIARTARANERKAATSRSNLHTLLSLGGINTPERQDSLSLLSPLYREGQRSYLNDRYECVSLSEMITRTEDLEMFKKMGLKPLK